MLCQSFPRCHEYKLPTRLAQKPGAQSLPRLSCSDGCKEEFQGCVLIPVGCRQRHDCSLLAEAHVRQAHHLLILRHGLRAVCKVLCGHTSSRQACCKILIEPTNCITFLSAVDICKSEAMLAACQT